MALRTRVCRVDEVGPGEIKGFTVEGLVAPVLVANLDGTYVASSSICPHDDVSLLGGKRRGTRIICPGHGYQFDLVTGACSHDPRMTLARYKVTIADGELYIELF